MLKRKTPLRSKSKKLLSVIKGSDPAILDKLKAKGLVRKASSLSGKRKPTGEWRWFVDEIWPGVEHCCEVCRAGIDEPRPINLSHRIPKGRYPDYRMDPRNAGVHCAACHERWHQYGNQLRTSWMWSGWFEKFDALKQEAEQKR